VIIDSRIRTKPWVAQVRARSLGANLGHTSAHPSRAWMGQVSKAIGIVGENKILGHFPAA
jgi:hypothetical protein